jgi:hypothetical protein
LPLWVSISPDWFHRTSHNPKTPTFASSMALHTYASFPCWYNVLTFHVAKRVFDFLFFVVVWFDTDVVVFVWWSEDLWASQTCLSISFHLT